LGYLDAVAAVLVGAMIAKMGGGLVWGAMSELLDAGLEAHLLDRLRAAINSVDGVRSIHSLRTRRQGHEALADVHVQVAPRLSVSEGHMISVAVEDRIKRAVAEMSDVVVHIDPEDDEEAVPCEGLPLRAEASRELASMWHDVPGFGSDAAMLLHYLSGRISVDLFLPLERYQSAAATRALQRALQTRLDADPRYGRVTLHYSLGRAPL
jgi:hypothetical protein